MKRLLGLTGITCLCALTACFYLQNTTVVIIGICALVLFAGSMLVPSVRKEGTLPLAFITVVVSVALFMGFTHLFVTPVQNTYEDKTCVVTAVQKAEVYKSDSYYVYELDVKEIDGVSVNTGMILYTDEHIFSDPYDEIQFEAILTSSTYGSDLSKGLYLRAFLLYDPQVKITTPDTKPFMYHIINLRKELRTSLYKELPSDTAAFSSAVLLGDKHALDSNVKELLRICGLSHISVVSGLHLSVLAAVFVKLFKFLFRNKYVSSIFTILAILGFALLSGFGIPVIRSAVMLIIFTIGNLIPRRSDSLNSIGAAALLILLYNPYAVGDVGMLLSFSATIGIVAWSDKLSAPVMNLLSKLRIMKYKLINYIAKTLVYTAVCSICATVWTLPVAILCFGGVSLVGVVANLLTVPFMSVLLVCVALCVLTHYIEFLPLISDIFAFAVKLYYEYLMFICTTLSKLPFAYADTDKPYFYFWLAATLILIAVAVLINSKNARTITVIFSVLIFVWSSLAYNLSRESVLTLYVPDTGSGLSVVLESSEGHAVLCCGGSKWKTFSLSNVVEEVIKQDKNLLVSTAEENSVIFAEKLRTTFDYDTVLLYDNNGTYAEPASGSQTDEVKTYSADHTLYLWDKAVVELMVYDTAVFEYITAGDTQVLILPDNADCQCLDSKYLTPDIVVTHGVVENMGLLTCETLIIPGDDYISQVTAELSAPIAEKVITGTDIVYDIKIN